MKLSLRRISAFCCSALLLAAVSTAHAVTFSVSGEVWEGGAPDNPGTVAPIGSSIYSTTPSAAFTVTNTAATNLFNFNSNNAGGDYTLSNFLTSGGDGLSYITGSGHAGDSIDDDLFEFTGNTTLSSNTVYDFEHDDGLLLYLNGTLVVNQGGPTSAENTTLCVGSPSGSPTCDFSIANPGGSESFSLLYAEVDGAPAVLETSLPLTGPPPNLTPEPSSFIMLGSGLLAAAGMVRRRFVA
jgi:hypothetical protein